MSNQHCLYKLKKYCTKFKNTNEKLKQIIYSKKINYYYQNGGGSITDILNSIENVDKKIVPKIIALKEKNNKLQEQVNIYSSDANPNLKTSDIVSLLSELELVTRIPRTYNKSQIT